MAQPWLKYQQNQPSADPVIAVDPFKEEDQQFQRNNEARANEDQQIQRENVDVQRETNAVNRNNTTFNQYSKIRDDFNALPDVKEYRTAIKAYVTALKSGEDPAGDLNLIYTFAKIMDPGSVVREGETAMVAGGDTLYGQTVATLKKQLGEGGTFRPEYRNELRRELQTRIAEMNRAYNNQRGQYEQFARAAGLEPEQVLGRHDGTAFYEDIKDYWEKHGSKVVPEGQDAQGNALPAGARLEQSQEPPVDGNSPGYQQFAAGLGDILSGTLNNTVGLAVNPFNTVVGRASGYDGFTSNIGETARASLGLPRGTGWISDINQAAAGGLGIGSIARGGVGLASGATRNALAQLGSTPLRDLGAGAGAVVGGQAVNALGGGPVAQTAGQVVGGMVTHAAPNALLSMGRAGARPADLDMNVIAAGERQNVPVRLPDASPSARNRMATAEADPYSGPSVRRAINSDVETMKARVRTQGADGTAQTENYALGQRVRGVGERYIERTRNKKNANYTEAEQLAGGQRVVPQNAVSEVDRQIAELTAKGANNNAKLIEYLRGLKEDLTAPDGGFSITDFQGLRSGARAKIKGDQALTVTDADRRLKAVAEAFTADAKDQLPPQASEALANADQFYAQRQDFIGSVLKPFLGSRGRAMSPEQTGKAFRGMVAGKANYDNLKRFIAEATPEEVGDFRATIAESIAGAKGAAGLAENIGKVPANIRQLVFGKEGAEALRDIELLAGAKGATAQGLNNSKSGVVYAAKQIGLRSLIGGVFGFGVGGPMGSVALPAAIEAGAALTQARTARLLLNPNFTRWLRQTPNSSKASVIDAHFSRLKDVAARSPIIANDVQALEGVLRDVFSKSPKQAVAKPEGEDERD